MNSEHDTKMTQGNFKISTGTTRLICHVGDMDRFPAYLGQVEEEGLKVLAEPRNEKLRPNC